MTDWLSLTIFNDKVTISRPDNPDLVIDLDDEDGLELTFDANFNIIDSRTGLI